MNIFQTVFYYVNMIGICIIVAFAIAGGILYYLLRVKKITAKVENIDTSRFDRKNPLCYVPFEDAVSKDGSLDSDGMFVINDTVFVAGVSVRGFQYGSASASERVSAEVNSVAFFNVVEQPTSFRRQGKMVDLTDNINIYKERAKQLALEVMELNAEYESTLNSVDDYIDKPDILDRFSERLSELEKMRFAKTQMYAECDALVRYQTALSSDAQNKKDAVVEPKSQIMFSYIHDASSYSEELTKEEIYIKAQEALQAQANVYIDALSYCHFRAKRLSQRELLSALHHCTSPVTATDKDIEDLLDSSLNTLFVSSDSLVRAQIEKIGEEAYKQKLQEYESKMAEMLKQKRMDMERTVRVLDEDTYEEAVRITNGLAGGVL